MSLIVIYVLLFGAVIGSFLNVCISRIPKDRSIVLPASHCPNCGKHINFYDNIPIISFFLLNGRCRSCHQRISWQYPTVEILNVIGYELLFYYFGLGWTFFIYIILFSSLLVVTFIDLNHQIVPDRITFPGMIFGIATASTVLSTGMWGSLSGIVVGGGIFYIIAVVSKGGMGGGDIKLIAMIGAFLGWRDVLLIIFLASLSGSLVGVILMVFKGKKRRDPIPFGPFLSLATVIAFFVDNEILQWYANLGVN
ncbi:MAG: prepilin peptidase [Nitrospirota bacterium]